MFVAVEKFISNLIKINDKHAISINDGRTWCPSLTCEFLKLKHHIHIHLMRCVSSKEQYNTSKRQDQSFDNDYFPYNEKKCKLNMPRIGYTFYILS